MPCTGRWLKCSIQNGIRQSFPGNIYFCTAPNRQRVFILCCCISMANPCRCCLMPFISKDVIRSFMYSFREVHRATRFYTWASVGPALIASMVPLFTVYLIKLVIDETSIAMASADKAQAFQKVLWLVVITGLVFLLNNVAEAVEEYIRKTREQLFFDHIYEKIQDKTAAIDLEYFEDDKYYDLFSRALENAPIRPLNVVNHTISVLQNSLALLTLGGLLLTLHPAVFLVLLAATVPLGLVKLYFTGRLYDVYKRNTRNERRIWDINDVLTREPFAIEVRLFRLKAFFSQLFRTIRTGIRHSYLSIYKQRMLFETAAQIIAAFAVFGAFGFISYQAVYGVLTIGALTMYLVAIQKGVGLFNNIFHNLSNLYEDSLYVVYLDRFLKIKPRTQKAYHPKGFPTPLQQGISFRQVSFRYPGSKRNALEDINMDIPAGKTVALVGPNGAGKTTLIKLLCRFYDPEQGEILADGISLKEMSHQEVRENISALFQDFAHYNFTAEENIRFGDNGRETSHSRVVEAAKKAEIHEDIQALPRGYDTVLGKIYNDSEELSIGQWQKMGLARAFYKDSQIVILDEPTAAMDPDAEHQIFSMFKKAMENKTAILVSHRFSTVQMADYIYVMDKERIVEEGTHQELLAKQGLYYRMFTKQAMYYR